MSPDQGASLIQKQMRAGLEQVRIPACSAEMDGRKPSRQLRRGR